MNGGDPLERLIKNHFFNNTSIELSTFYTKQIQKTIGRKY